MAKAPRKAKKKKKGKGEVPRKGKEKKKLLGIMCKCIWTFSFIK